MPVTSGMKGDGFYDRHSSPQFAAIAAVLPWLEHAVGRMDLSRAATPIVVVDYGCSEGRNSIAAMQEIVAALRRRTPRPIQIVHSDLPTNNFNQLFLNLSAASTAGTREQVYSGAVGGSMFEPLMPPQTVSIATTFNAIGFLERRPQAGIADYILPMGPGRPRPGVTVAESEKRAYADQAAEDLVHFYRARAEEIIPGGTLLVASFGIDERYRSCDGIYDVLNDALLDLRETGRLGRDACRDLVLPIYFRSKEELVAPVVREDSPIAGRFQVDRVESMEVAVPFTQRWEQSGDVTAYAEEFTGFLRAFSEPILRQSFADQTDLENLLGSVYERVRARLAADPTDYEFHYIQVAALLTRL
jgi:gibberellin A4 carboxyl methyltransferase